MKKKYFWQLYISRKNQWGCVEHLKDPFQVIKSHRIQDTVSKGEKKSGNHVNKIPGPGPWTEAVSCIKKSQ